MFFPPQFCLFLENAFIRLYANIYYLNLHDIKYSLCCFLNSNTTYLNPKIQTRKFSYLITGLFNKLKKFIHILLHSDRYQIPHQILKKLSSLLLTNSIYLICLIGSLALFRWSERRLVNEREREGKKRVIKYLNFFI